MHVCILSRLYSAVLRLTFQASPLLPDGLPKVYLNASLSVKLKYLPLGQQLLIFKRVIDDFAPDNNWKTVPIPTATALNNKSYILLSF